MMTFDANRRLAEIALWTDAGAHWIGREVERKLSDRRAEDVTVTFDRAELERFVLGLRWISRSLLGLAQPVPPLVVTDHPQPKAGWSPGPALRVVA
jgi:hypothetical protein